MIKKFSNGADIRLTITMKPTVLNIKGGKTKVAILYEDCHTPENPFGVPGWVSFWAPPSPIITAVPKINTLVQVPLDQVEKIELVDYNEKIKKATEGIRGGSNPLQTK